MQKPSKMLVLGLVLVGVLALASSGAAISDPSGAKLTMIGAWLGDAWTGEQLLGEWGFAMPGGLIVEIKVEADAETTIWPSDVAIGFDVAGKEGRLSAYALSNAVSDPEDERAWRFNQPITVRKGTRYFLAYFMDTFSFDYSMNEMEELTLLYRVLVPGAITVVKPEVVEEEYDDYGW